MDKSNGRASKRKQVRNSKRDDELDKIFRSFIEGVKDVIEDFVSKITTCWYRSTKAIFDTATICAQADEQLNPAQKKKLLKRLPFGQSTFSKLVQIGKDQRIPKIIKRLPPSMSTIYEVTLLSDEQLDQAKEAHIISAEATRDGIKLFRESGKTDAAAGTSEPADDFDNSFDDDEKFLEDDQEEPEESIEGDDAYDAVVGEWLKQGLRRTKWQALTKKLQKKFIEEVLLREPFKRAA